MRSDFGVFDLVVAEAEVTELLVVFRDGFAEVDDAGVVFEVRVSSYKAAV